MNEGLTAMDRRGKVLSAGVVGGCLLGCAIAIILTLFTVNGMAQRAAAVVATDMPDTSANVVSGDTVTVDEKAEPLIAQGEVETDKVSGAQTYTVVAGDTLSGVSAKTGVSVDHLAKANKIENVHMIYAGSVLTIPEVISKV